MNDNEEINEPVNIYSKLGSFDNPTAYAKIKGICGDEMEFYIIIENDIVRGIKFLTTGCYFTIVCGNAVACEVEGKNVIDALKINPKHIITTARRLPTHHYHCSILAVSTFHKAIAGYFLEKYGDDE
jgi:nitrogen fixation protein NifU and related proteins